MSALLSRILVIKLGALGDFVQALGPMAAIRRHHADAHIVLLTTAPYAALAQVSGYVDEVWLDERPSLFAIAGWLALRRRLRAGRFYRVYDLQTSDRSSWYFRLLGPGPRPEWSGIAAGCSHPDSDPARDRMHTIERQASQLRAAGIPAVPLPDVSWASASLAHFALPPAYGLLVPGGAAHRPTKRWPIESYAVLAGRLAAAGSVPVVLGIRAEGSLARTIAAACPVARDLTGQTSLAEVASLARKATVAIGNDTGPMHLIAAAGCPSVVLFSADSDPALCAPRGAQVVVLRSESLAELSVETAWRALPRAAASP